MNLTTDEITKAFKQIIIAEISKKNDKIAFVHCLTIDRHYFDFYDKLDQASKDKIKRDLTAMFIPDGGGTVDIYTNTTKRHILFTFSRRFRLLSGRQFSPAQTAKLILDKPHEFLSNALIVEAGRAGKQVSHVNKKIFNEYVTGIVDKPILIPSASVTVHEHAQPAPAQPKSPTHPSSPAQPAPTRPKSQKHPSSPAHPKAPIIEVILAPPGVLPQPPFRTGSFHNNQFQLGEGATASTALFGFADSQNYFFEGDIPTQSPTASPTKSPTSPIRSSTKPASLAIVREEDCIAELRKDAFAHIAKDLETATLHKNGSVTPFLDSMNLKSPRFIQFCNLVHDFRSRHPRDGHQVLMLAYHGTPYEQLRDAILRKNKVEHGKVNKYGKGAYFTPHISVAARYGEYIIAVVLLLDSAHYHWRDDRPEDYIVNSEIQAQLPLYHFRLKSRKDSIKGQPIDISGLTTKRNRILGNASTTKKYMGGTKHKKTRILYMTLDGVVGETVI